MAGLTVTTAVSDFEVSAEEVARTVTCAGLGAAEGAVYTPVEEIVPHAAPLQPLPLTLQVTAVLVLPATVAVNCWVSPAFTCAVFGETFTDTGTAIVSVAEPEIVGSATETALIVTCGGVGVEGGAV